MSLYETWVKQAYNSQGQSNPKIWKYYLQLEQKIYEYILENKITAFEFTVSGLAEKYELPVYYICGFVDGIKEALDNEVDPEQLEDETRLCLNINYEKLYKKMIEYKAHHLYSLPQWERIFEKTKLDELKFEMTGAKVFVRDSEKIGRNDSCPCGSGKKYKKCCGA